MKWLKLFIPHQPIRYKLLTPKLDLIVKWEIFNKINQFDELG
ncbi:MAG: hypothetical protein UZ11_BCD004000340 [Bacteroidetes bacterium OLB11]|nr:MAG: hypothetical protein UZ11_BCD004000340 [Bacteroidetes bacterium OLB11]